MKTRTSASHPLLIAELEAGAGVVGVTLCPGKQCAALAGYRWERDLLADVEAIRRWGASAVVTLIESSEFGPLHVEGLPAAVAAAGLEWHHLPVTDVQPPDGRFEGRWWYAGARLREWLRAGERVLVHCRGGLGRAGSVAARLLVEFGCAPEEAMRRVRAARPGAIETVEQERWVLAQRPVDPVTDRRRARELACLLGGAIGDALGYRVEFDSLARRHGARPARRCRPHRRDPGGLPRLVPNTARPMARHGGAPRSAGALGPVARARARQHLHGGARRWRVGEHCCPDQ